MTDSCRIRRFDPALDSIPDLTALLHRAYAPLAEAGMRYLASHQDDEITRSRISKGECWVALDDANIMVGTVVLVPPGVGDPENEYYCRPGVAWFQQFAVEPGLQGQGVGSLMMDHIEGRAGEMQATEIALDTSDQATNLIAMYQKRNYEIVSEADWSITNYRSVIMRKLL